MISTTGEYALRAAVFLAQHHGMPKTTQEIAEATKVPQGYLSKILQAMVRRRLISSQRGLGGGFQLTREPDEINALEILASVDSGPERITRCPLGITGHTSLCPLHRLVDDAVANTEAAFRGATLESLIRTTRGILPLCEDSPPAGKRRAGRGVASKGRPLSR